MLFTDPLFLFYFLPATLLLLRLSALGGRLTTAARAVIIVSTLVFYGYGNILWPLLFAVVVGGIYACTLVVLASTRPRVRRIAITAAIVFSILVLGLFKYINWLATLIPALRGVQALLAPHFGQGGVVILPPGISFYVFEALSFAIDAYRGRIARPVRPLDYLTFLAMFPRFIAGPIVRYDEISAQYRTWSGLALRNGLTIFAFGFALKVLFADQFSVFVPYGFAVTRPDLLQSWAGALAYTFQLYFDFWGYSLMATGLGLCLGFAFPDNFRSPYRAVSITEFWQRWHMTLSRWLRDYVYISLGGNRCSRARVLLNLFLTMVIGGLWHGANFTFVVWGAYHGALLMVERALGEERLARVPVPLRRLVTFVLVVAGWVIFRSDSLPQAGDVLAGMVGLHGIAPGFSPALLDAHLLSLTLILGAIVFWRYGEQAVVGATPLYERRFHAGTRLVLFGAFILGLLISLSSAEIPFLYFQF